MIGIAQVAGSTNLKIAYGGSAAQTPIDLGSNYPATNSSTNYPYKLALYSDPFDNTAFWYQVWRYGTSAIHDFTTGPVKVTAASGTAMPGQYTFIVPRAWRSNNATASQVELVIGSMAVHGEA